MAVFTDTFDGAADAPVSGRTGWALSASGYANYYVLDGNGAVKVLAGGDGNVTLHTTGSTDLYVKVVVGAGFIASEHNVLIHIGASNRYARFTVSYNAATSELRVRGSRGGSHTGAGSATLALAAGDELHIEMKDSTARLVIKVNGTTVTNEDTAYFNDPSYGAVGFATSYNGVTSTLVDVFRSFEAGPLAAADTTPPTLGSASAAATGATSAGGGVTTDEAGPAWAVLTTSAAKPTAAQVKVGQNASGTAAAAFANATLGVGANAAAFTFGGLTASTSYYMHVVQDDTASPANTSAAATSAQFTTGLADTTPPLLSSGTATVKSNALIALGATTDEANGTLYAVLTASATAPTAAQVCAGQNHTGAAAAWSGSQAIASTGAKTFNATGLTASTDYYPYLAHRDASGNDTAVLALGLRTTFRDGATGQWILDHPGSFMAQCVQAGEEDDWFDWELVTPPATGAWTDGPYADGTGVFQGPDATSTVIRLRKNGSEVGYFTVFLYDATATATAVQGGSWSVRNPATSAQAGAWSVRQLVASTQAGAWSVLAPGFAGAIQPGAWSVRGLVSVSQSGAWGVRNLVAVAQPGAWSVLAPGVTVVSATQSGAWSVLGLVSATQAGAWSVRDIDPAFIVGASQSGAWSVLGALRAFSSELRTVRIYSDGAGLLGKFTMQPGEVLDFCYDFQPWLDDCGDSIASIASADGFTITPDTSSMQVLETDRIGGQIVGFVQATENGLTHKLTGRIHTVGGRTKEADIQIRIKEV